MERIREHLPIPNLTSREFPETILTRFDLKLLDLVSRGYSGPEIAIELRRAHQTIKNRREMILQKLGAANSAHAVRIGIELGLIQVDIKPPDLSQG